MKEKGDVNVQKESNGVLLRCRLHVLIKRFVHQSSTITREQQHVYLCHNVYQMKSLTMILRLVCLIIIVFPISRSHGLLKVNV